MSTPKLYAATTARADRAEDGIRQIEDLVGALVANPGLESNVVELVKSACDELRESRETIAMLAQQLADKKEIIRRLTS